MNNTLTSFTRACSVISEFCGSSADAPLTAFEAFSVGGAERYGDWAHNWAAPAKVASKSAKICSVQFVYFMPGASNFFTVNRVPTRSPAIRCTPGAEILRPVERLLLDFRGGLEKCQVTKGAHVWSWHKTCNPNDLRDLGSCAGHCYLECVKANIVAQSSRFSIEKSRRA